MSVLDTSSSAPAGLLEGTPTNFGDFDGCINIRDFKTGDSELVQGKYFHMITHLVNRTRPSNREVNGEKIALINEAGFDEVGITLSLCLPDSCSNDDFFSILKEVFKCYPDIYILNDINSDTRETVSFTYKWRKISSLQKVAVYVPLFFLTTSPSLLPDYFTFSSS